MRYMNKYAIESEDSRAVVIGSLSEDGEVIVRYDNKEYVFNSGSGDFTSGPCSAEVYCNDGSYVKEGAVTQDILLQDGTKIHKGACERTLELPCGEKFVTKNENGTNIKIGGVDMNISVSTISFDTADSNNNKNINIEQEQVDEIKPEDDDWVSKKDLTESLTPGFFTSLFFILGLISLDPSGISIGVGLYLFYALPTTVRYVVQRKINVEYNTANNSVNTSESKTGASEIEDVKERYANGEISDVEFENEIEDILSEKDQLKFEKQYN